MKLHALLSLAAFILILAILSISLPSMTLAQQGASSGNQANMAKKKDNAPQVMPESIPSLFFTFWQQKAITDAKNSRGVVRPPTQAEIDAMATGEEVEKEPGIRNITVGGILFTTESEWTVWLNGQRVTPKAIPKEVLDLRVFDGYIEIKWLDEYTNQVFPLRLKAHERFNLDTRMFLPG